MERSCRNHSPGFKAKIALEALRGAILSPAQLVYNAKY
jgi:hypothetical protein